MNASQVATLHPDGPASLKGQHAVVTGAARGVGKQIAIDLARSGAAVTVLDVLNPATTVEEIGSEGGRATGSVVDVGDRRAVKEAIHTAGERETRLDILVTSAAIYGDTTDLDHLDEPEVDRLLNINLKGTLWCLQAALPLLRRASGRVVCIGSVAGKIGGVLAGPHYVASKGGVHAIVKWLAKTESDSGIIANGIAPGVVDTDMITNVGYQPDYCPLGRFAQPEEIARLAAFLASPAASYLTGTVVDANGGSAMA